MRLGIGLAETARPLQLVVIEHGDAHAVHAVVLHAIGERVAHGLAGDLGRWTQPVHDAIDALDLRDRWRRRARARLRRAGYESDEDERAHRRRRNTNPSRSANAPVESPA